MTEGWDVGDIDEVLSLLNVVVMVGLKVPDALLGVTMPDPVSDSETDASSEKLSVNTRELDRDTLVSDKLGASENVPDGLSEVDAVLDRLANAELLCEAVRLTVDETLREKVSSGVKESDLDVRL